MSSSRTHSWPNFEGINIGATTDALHLWCQVVGKVRLMLTPWLNYSWHATLYVSARGLSTGLIHAGDRAFDIEFDILADTLWIRVSDGEVRRVGLCAQSVADFYRATMQGLRELGLMVDIHRMPCEIPDAVTFTEDVLQRAYDGDVARTYWRALVQVNRVLETFRSGFIGKCSPVHLFWGSFDLAVTRFFGRIAPRHPGGMPHVPNSVAREAYSHEVSSACFWPGGGQGAAFYSYAYPTPEGFSTAKVAPDAATFDPQLGEFILPYNVVQRSADPDGELLTFLQTTYNAASDLAHWDRARLERPQGLFGRPPEGV